jgi:hypothetical protein
VRDPPREEPDGEIREWDIAVGRTPKAFFGVCDSTMPKELISDAAVKIKLMTFAEKFCAMHHVPASAYEKEMLSRSLYAPGKLIWRLVGSDAGCFAADREFIGAVGKLTSLHGFEAEMWAFTVNPENSRFHRLSLRMRVSSKRVYQQLVDVMRPSTRPASRQMAIPPAA